MTNFRHEWKHEINPADCMLLKSRLQAVMTPDVHGENGYYEIRSLYFDDASDSALRDKMDGINIREKFRIRCYDRNLTMIRLEKKSKINGLCAKESAILTMYDVYSSYNTYGASGTFVYDGKTYRTYGATKNANPDLKWESTGMLNIGLDFAFLKGRLNGTVEVYHKKTKDLIWSYPVSTTQYIYGWMDANVGEMTNKGIEFTLNAVPVRTKNIMWSTTLNLSHNKNTVDKMQNETFHTTNLTQGDPMVAGVSADGWTQRIMEGEPIGTFYTYQYAGTVNGRSEYYVLDENGNRTGETTNNPSLKDRSITGCAQPKLNAGWNNTLTYKNWSLNAFITGVFGNDVYNSARAHYTAAQMFSDGKNVLKEFLSNPVGDASSSLPSDRYIEKGSYVRLQTLSLSYTFRNCFNDWIQDLTLYGTANNLFTITSYKGLDPEVNMGGIDPGIDYRWSRYPHTRTFMVGVKINFGGSKKK